MATSLGELDWKLGMSNISTEIPAQQETRTTSNNTCPSNSNHKIGCRCRNCCAKEEEGSISAAMEEKNEVVECPPALVPGASIVRIAEKSTQHDPECRCRDCQYEACEHGWELVEDRVYTDDSPQEEFCDLQELIDICAELDETADGGHGN